MSNNIRVNGMDYFGISKVKFNDINGGTVIFSADGGGTDMTPFLEGTIETFTIPADANSLREGVFYGCKMLKSIEVENGNTAYKAIDGVLFSADGTVLFAYPAGKEGAEYAIPSEVTSIADQAFNGSDVAVVLDAGLLNAGGAYPLATDSIKTVMIPEDATFLDLDAFNNLTGIETVYYNATNCTVEVSGFESKDGYYYDGNPFYNCRSLKELIIGNTVAEISAGMCYGTSAQDLLISSSVTSIGEYAFARSAIANVVIPGNVININHDAFVGANLSSLTIEEGVTILGYNAFSNNRSLTEVTIPKSVTEIGIYCFAACGLSSVTILNPEAIIDFEAFYGNPENMIIRGYTGSTAQAYANENGYTFEAIDTPFTITADNRYMIGYTGSEGEMLTIPMTFSDGDGNVYLVTAIDANAFSDCVSLASITIPSSVSSIGANAFSGCTSLTTIYFNGTTSKFDFINKEAGWRDSSSVVVVCNDGEWFETTGFVVTAENRHMVGYTGAENEELVIPATFVGDDGVGYKVTGIGDDAFQNCEGLASVKLPYTVSTVSDEAFVGSDNVEVILELSPALLSEGGAYPVSSNRINTVIVPEGATYVDYDLLMNLPNVTNFHCYANCEFETVGVSDGKSTIDYNLVNTSTSQIRKLVVGGQINIIDSSMFNRAINLEELIVADGVTTIGYMAFWECSNLKSVVISDSVTTMESMAFNYCTSLEEVTLSNNLTSIGDRAFSECWNLSAITIPNSVTYIGEMAFTNYALSTINYTGTVSEWSMIALGESWNFNASATEVNCSDGTVSLVS